jgi:hypothetical protein
MPWASTASWQPAEAKKKNLPSCRALQRYDFLAAMQRSRRRRRHLRIRAQYNTPGLPKWPITKQESG